MCGVAGWLYVPGAAPRPRVLFQMLDEIEHRGPDLSSLRTYRNFQGSLSLQALEISRDGDSSESTTAFLVHYGTIACIEAPIDLDSIPLLGVASVIESHVVVLTPEKWNSVKLFATTKNILSCYLSHALSNHPVLDANSFAGGRIGPTSGFADREDSRHV